MKNNTNGLSWTTWEAEAEQNYMNEIRRHPMLDEQEERKLVIQMVQGDRAARERLIVANLRSVVAIARRYAGRTLTLMDLVQEGNLGLMHAADLFRPEEGTRFLTYATWHIRQAITQALVTKDELIRRSKDDEEEPVQSFDDEQKPVGAIHDGENEDDEPEETTTSPTVAPTAVQRIDHALLTQALRKAMDTLDDQQRYIVASLYGVDGQREKTSDELSEEFGLTPRRIRQIAQRALAQLLTASGTTLEEFL